MMRKRPRSRVEIYADILLALNKMGTCDKLSRLAMMVGVPYDRLVRYLEELKSMGLVRWEPFAGVSLTLRGYELTMSCGMDRDSLIRSIDELRTAPQY
ncbi:winged helix-turn-helix domain-containing protein [Vulcanisaeta thermophila]|uniref:winged helix-turn-helix domain-containing protein n=1 Tax=Vulcanisaeta thermophila TaxID=867917 RepID=UPI000852E56C|nr:winged helix-turn-helix domain-containing protein [Vulcanisaeta thermophila]